MVLLEKNSPALCAKSIKALGYRSLFSESKEFQDDLMAVVEGLVEEQRDGR